MAAAQAAILRRSPRHIVSYVSSLVDQIDLIPTRSLVNMPSQVTRYQSLELTEIAGLNATLRLTSRHLEIMLPF